MAVIRDRVSKGIVPYPWIGRTVVVGVLLRKGNMYRTDSYTVLSSQGCNLLGAAKKVQFLLKVAVAGGGQLHIADPRGLILSQD